MSAELLRRAAVVLRNPYRCNNDPIQDRCLADWMDETARLIDARVEVGDRIEDLAVAAARAVLRRQPAQPDHDGDAYPASA